MKARLLTGLTWIALLPFNGGCQTEPLTYSQWKAEQAERARCAAAGIPYKSPSELRREAEEMRHVSEDVTFSPTGRN